MTEDLLKIETVLSKANFLERWFGGREYYLKTPFGLIDVPDNVGYYVMYLILEPLGEITPMILHFTGQEVEWFTLDNFNMNFKEVGYIEYEELRTDTGMLERASKIVNRILKSIRA